MMKKSEKARKSVKDSETDGPGTNHWLSQG